MKQFRRVLCIAVLLLCFARLPVSALEPGGVYSGAAVLLDDESGQILFEKQKDEPVYPASTTKIMTAILVLEHAETDEVVTVSESALDIDEWDSANIGLSVGEEITVDDALYALMLPSANDMANALAEHVSGSQDAFAELMTEKAHELGAVNTHFVSAHGLPDDNHYTTAYDMALITRYAIRNRDFLRYFGASEHTVPPTNLQPIPRELSNYQAMLVPGSEFYDPSVIGGKVGYTGPARHTMSTVAEKHGRTLIAVVMLSGRVEKFFDTAAMLRHGFEDFQAVSLPASFFAKEIPVTEDGNENGTVEFFSETSFPFLLRNDLRLENVYADYPSLTPDAPPATVAVRIGGEGILLGTQEIKARPQFDAEAIPSWLAYPSEEPVETGGWPLAVVILAALIAVILLLILLQRVTARRRSRSPAQCSPGRRR